MSYENTESGLKVSIPADLQGKHEEADTVIAHHGKVLCGKSILVRSSDTDVLIILLALVGRLALKDVKMDYGSGNTRRYIGVSGIAENLDKTSPCLT